MDYHRQGSAGESNKDGDKFQTHKGRRKKVPFILVVQSTKGGGRGYGVVH